MIIKGMYQYLSNLLPILKTLQNKKNEKIKYKGTK